ncbi:hypothetical protein E8E11_000227 [Didymella keratinophila]|nr:hypothetical protein E8E11_000227 [Didymella keratinophila]
MSHVFLDRDGNGELYWPTDPTSPNHTCLQYANQQSLIRKCVKELLYRSNVQQYRNTKYRRKGVSVEDANDDAHEYPVDSIEILSGDEAPRSATEDAHAISNTRETVEAARNKSKGQEQAARQAHQASTVSSHTSPVTALEDDVFEVPDDFDWVPPQGTSNALKRRLRKGDSLVMSPAMNLNGTSGSALDSEHTERAFHNPQGDSAAPSTELSVTTPIHRTPEELVNYIRSNRPLTTLRPNAVLESDQTTASANVDQPIDPVLERAGTVPSARLSSGSREDSVAVGGPRDLERSRQTSSPTAPARTVPGSEEPPEKRTVDLTETQPTQKSTSMCADAVNKMVQIRYRLVLTHRSLPVREVWAPKGNLLNKTLQSLELEIPLKEGFKGFILRLLAPDYHTEEVIDAGDEFGFQYAKNHLNQVICGLASMQKRTRPGKAVPVFIEIEPRRSNDEEGDMEASESVKIEW